MQVKVEQADTAQTVGVLSDAGKKQEEDMQEFGTLMMGMQGAPGPECCVPLASGMHARAWARHHTCARCMAHQHLCVSQHLASMWQRS